jgi:hypothetical protein
VKLREIIDTYLRGWELGDGELSLGVTSANFHYDDPNTGRIAREDFVEFVEDFKRAAVEMGGESGANPFLEYSDVVIDDSLRPAIVWCWWRAAGTDLQGCARVLVDEEGVQHEKIAYFSRLPDG